MHADCILPQHDLSIGKQGTWEAARGAQLPGFQREVEPLRAEPDPQLVEGERQLALSPRSKDLKRTTLPQPRKHHACSCMR